MNDNDGTIRYKFQFQSGAIKGQNLVFASPNGSSFQFQSGAIKGA